MTIDDDDLTQRQRIAAYAITIRSIDASLTFGLAVASEKTLKLATSKAEYDRAMKPWMVSIDALNVARQKLSEAINAEDSELDALEDGIEEALSDAMFPFDYNRLDAIAEDGIRSINSAPTIEASEKAKEEALRQIDELKCRLDIEHEIVGEAFIALGRAEIIALRVLGAISDRDATIAWIAGDLQSLATDPKPIQELSDEGVRYEVARHVADVLTKLAPHVATKDGRAKLDVRDGMLSWDAALADAAAGIGTEGRKLAKAVRAKGKKRQADYEAGKLDVAGRFHAWFRPHQRETQAILLLGRVIWLDIVRPKIKREAERNPAGLVRAVVHERLLPAMTRQLVIPTLDDGTVRDASGKVIGRITVTTDATLEAARNGLAQLGSVAGHRLVRSLVHRAHDQYEAGTGDFRHVRYEGGFAALLETVGLGPNYGETIREIAEAGQAIRWHASHAEGGGFWTWTHQRGARGRQGHVSFVLGEMLLPGNATTMRIRGNQSPSARMARRVIPELRGEVPIPPGLSPDKHGAAWTLHRMMLVELVDHARALATDGFASIPSSRVVELARGAGLTKAGDIARVLDAFTNGAGNVAPIFKRDGDGWTLADYHARERDYIADLGKRQATGQAGGKLAARKRNEEAPRRRRSRET